MKKDFATVFVALAIMAGVLCLSKTIIDKARTADDTQSVYIVYTDDSGEPYAEKYVEPITYNNVYYPLTMDERETLAEILAGKAADRTEACQRMVATVMYNDITSCRGDLEAAMTEYHLKTPGTPNAQIYGVIDAVFYGGEFMLDPEVLWCNDKDHPSAFHDSLVLVCECDGMAFYREHRDNIEH